MLRWLEKCVKRIGRELSVFRCWKTRIWAVDYNLCISFSRNGIGKLEKKPGGDKEIIHQNGVWSWAADLNQVAFLSRENNSVITGALTWRIWIYQRSAPDVFLKVVPMWPQINWRILVACVVEVTLQVLRKSVFSLRWGQVGGCVRDGTARGSDGVISGWALPPLLPGPLRAVITLWILEFFGNTHALSPV